MDNWNDYLASQGAPLRADDTAQLPPFGQALTIADLTGGFVAIVGTLGLIAVGGADAASFLHKQLTSDIDHLAIGAARLAGYCSPKGRLQASFLIWRDADTVFLQLPRELQAVLQKRLAMFVMRDKATLSDAGAGHVVLAFGGAAAQAALLEHVDALPAAPYATVTDPRGTLIRLADAFGAPCYQWWLRPADAAAVMPALLSSGALALGGDQAWQLAAIHAGVPHITVKTQDQFVPQMVNFELLGGVNFKKGCYPGQEIVARSQYLGKLKRRTVLASIAGATAQAGDEVFAVDDPGQPCGMVVNAAANGTGGVDALVEMKLAALAAGDIRLGSADGMPLAFLPMPYPLDALEL